MSDDAIKEIRRQLALPFMSLAGASSIWPERLAKRPKDEGSGEVKIPGAQTSPDVLPGRGRVGGVEYECERSRVALPDQ
jgi:hypothetical protein